jgi:hypothetical protein
MGAVSFRAIVDVAVEPVVGVVVYRDDDLAFDFVPAGDRVRGVASLAFGSVVVEVDETGRLLYAWGYAPRTAWHEALLPEPPAVRGGVTVSLPSGVPQGASVAVCESNRVGITHDSMSGWVRAGRTDANGDSFVMFCDGTVLELEEGEITAVWLRPVWL